MHCHYQKCKTNGIQIGPRMERLGLSMYQDCSRVELQHIALYCLLHMQERKRERALYGGKALKFAMHCWITGWTRHQLAPLLFYFGCEIKKEHE